VYQRKSQENAMAEKNDGPKAAGELAPARAAVVKQVERHDYPDLAPANGKRTQPMRGFDEIYTDIVDYIVRCTHKIWDERDIGLIYSHYTHNCVLYGTTGTLYTREEVVRDTIQRLVSFPERRGMATQVIWKGSEDDGFYTSHLVTGTGRHTQNGHLGAPTGRVFTSRTVADCMIFENKIYREWVVADTTAILQQLGLDVQAFAERIAKASFDKGLVSLDIGENRHMIGQYPPEAEADLSLVYNRKMLGTIARVCAPTVQFHGPLMAELYGVASVIHQTLGLIGSLPDAAFTPQHICSNPCEEGGEKVAVRWIMEGHHLGYGILGHLGAPTGKRVQVMGISHFHYKNGKIVDEWRTFDEASMLVQVKLAQMADVKAAALTAPH
jgi:predicted ester cyclase